MSVTLCVASFFKGHLKDVESKKPLNNTHFPLLYVYISRFLSLLRAGTQTVKHNLSFICFCYLLEPFFNQKRCSGSWHRDWKCDLHQSRRKVKSAAQLKDEILDVIFHHWNLFTKYIYSTTALKYNFGSLVLYISISIFCCFILFAPLYLSNSSSYSLLCRWRFLPKATCDKLIKY